MTGMRPLVVLVGPPGSGKSTVGALLAERLGADFRDTDAEIERRQGRTISDIFLDSGEQFFRRVEREEVARSLGAHPGVLALGGGSVMDPDVQERLAGHTVVYLQVGIADAARRVGFDRARPLLVLNPRAHWVRLLELRRPTYERVATFAVDTAGRTPQDVLAEIVSRVDATRAEVSSE